MRAWWAWITVVATAACSQSSSGSSALSCADASACGGYVVGTWTITEACVTPFGGGGCVDPTTQVTARVSGSITFQADTTFSGSITFSVTSTWDVPASCLMQDGPPASCDDFAALNYSDPNTTCVTSSVGCHCQRVAPEQTLRVNGAYMASGSIRSSEGDLTYCVSGDTLYISGPIAQFGGLIGTK